MTSSNGDIFRVTGPLCREFTGHWWILRKKASDTELWCFCAWIDSREAGDLRRRRAHYVVIVMMTVFFRHVSLNISLHRVAASVFVKLIG